MRRPSPFAVPALAAIALCSATAASATAPGTTAAAERPARLATLAIPGDPAFVRVARDVLDVVFAIDPSVAANGGLFDDAVRVPSYAPAAVQALVARLDRDLAAMRAMPWRSWGIDAQIDLRWVFASAETARHQLTVERAQVHRPAAWLEPLANDLIAFSSYVPDDRSRPARIWALVPAMLDEARRLATDVTARDRETARKLVAALRGMAGLDGSPAARDAARALASYDAALAALVPAREFTVIGKDAFRWRLARSMLVTLSPEELLGAAKAELVRIDRELAELAPLLPKPAPGPTPEERGRARALTRAGLLALYDGVSETLRSAIVTAGFVTIPAAVGPIRARETPDAMVPLTGDGGSMNPPPTFVGTNVGYWNVEHFRDDWSAAEREETVTHFAGWRGNSMGPYAAHEGFPGHHLQLAIARLHADPLRSILPDGVQNEGWGLYSEEELWRHGGLGKAPAARHAILRSYRFRAARVVYDVNIESGVWDLQAGADFQQRKDKGKGKVNEDVLRAIQWPTQLSWYFTGKLQIEKLKADYKRKLGAAYSDRAFHDAFLAEGSIPIALIRCKLLGEPVPAL